MKNIQLKKRGKYIAELDLCGVVGIQDARELATLLHEAHSTRHRLMVRCKDLQSIDSAALQILHAASKSFEESVLEIPEKAWQASFERAGLSDPFTPKKS